MDGFITYHDVVFMLDFGHGCVCCDRSDRTVVVKDVIQALLRVLDISVVFVTLMNLLLGSG